MRQSPNASRRSAVRLLAILSLLPAPVALTAQATPRLLARYGEPGVVLYQVRAADTRGPDVVLVSESDPPVQLIRDGTVDGRGRVGEGPEELASPSDVSWAEGGIVVLDLGNRKLVTFTNDGEAAAVRGLGGLWANRIFLVESDTILGAFVPMDRARAVLRVRGDERDTLYRYETRGEKTRLEAPDAPGYTVSPPFWPQPVWTILADGMLAVWEPGLGAIRILDGEGTERSRLNPAFDPLPVTDADREDWLDDMFEREFMGQHPFRPLREVAERELSFPERLPAALELLPDPDGGVWVRRNTVRAGAVWTRVDLDGTVAGDVRFPIGRDLLAVGEDAFVVHSLDELEADQIELYERTP